MTKDANSRDFVHYAGFDSVKKMENPNYRKLEFAYGRRNPNDTTKRRKKK